MASELAKEIVQLSQRRDRASPLALIVYSRSTISRDIRNERENMRVTAPIEDGKLIFRICFPAPNAYPLGSNVDRNQIAEQTILDFDEDNIEGAATCIEGYMTYRGKEDVMLFHFSENGDLRQLPLSRWIMDKRKAESTDERIKTLKQILRTLLVRKVMN